MFTKNINNLGWCRRGGAGHIGVLQTYATGFAVKKIGSLKKVCPFKHELTLNIVHNPMKY